MRDLSAFAALPRESELRETIPRRERFRPEPRIMRRSIIGARDDGYFDLTLPGHAPRRVHALVAEAHRAMNEGAPIEEVIARAAPHYHEGKRRTVVGTLLRNYYMDLARDGFVEIPFEEPPARFADRYERVKLLGRGGMGIAHLCRDTARDGRLVVVKHAWGWSAKIERAERTSRREALALSFLDHPLIPGLVETFERDGLLHLVRDFAPGRPLGSARDGTKSLPSGARLAIFRDMCDTIAHVHAQGLLYLDVKPDNFVLGDDGRARLIDFGICRPAVDTVEPIRSPIGSRGYVSPEMRTQRVATARSDGYALGRVLFHLATGQRPRMKHDGGTLRALMIERGIARAEADLVADLAHDDPERRAELPTILARLDALLQEGARPDAVAV